MNLYLAIHMAVISGPRTKYMSNRDTDDFKLRILSSSAENDLTAGDECLNSLFAISLFDYEETDIAYQFQSNMYQIMIDRSSV